jgi:hypothetical protein
VEEVARVLEGTRYDPLTAAAIVEAAATFRLLGRGLIMDHASALAHLPTPNIAYLSASAEPFPRPREKATNGYFAVTESITPERVAFVDPYEGPTACPSSVFLEHSCGIFLVFEPGTRVPTARIHKA